MKKKILIFGYLPKDKGGKQETGLATGIFDLHNAIAGLETDYDILFASTDISTTSTISNLKVTGWNKSNLLKWMLKNPFKFLVLAYRAFYLKLFFRQPFSRGVGYFLFFQSLTDSFNPDIIHFHGARWGLYGNYVFGGKSKKVLRIHGMNGYDENIDDYLSFRKIEKFLFTKSTYQLITFVATDVMNDFQIKYGNPVCRAVSILNGYNQEVFYFDDNIVKDVSFIKLLTFSTVYSRKGQLNVMKAIVKANLTKQITYTCIGNADAAYLKEIVKLSAENDVKFDHISYLPQNQLKDYIGKADFMILPSTSEGFGKVYIESIACGTPVMLPAELPLAKEPGILNQTNAIVLKDGSVEEIANVLERIGERKFDRSEVASSVIQLQWDNLALKYVGEYDRLMYN
ncbi:glycosyltransferase family 4 protein [Mucilaginibacter rigui]|uniref:Glycosyltransferase family 4 protein n=1 Tax=Mucilaginibacter rigui TaxID=534635 RepID=A0ABR7X6P6_9SPHI|nr:glycosyltransferase family 4 protein [Mucilaginibacter rigui]MBD1386231.1 glycosyltransferase family 4 protein [Mucilaginibacter rigui]